MKAGIVVEPGRVEIQNVPPPEPGPGEALVKIEVCGLCGTTDRHIVEGIQVHHPRT
jgi:D-arabinose 1-dehydrogenase-like Zn-dependent alcohol dehydrogenase